MSDWTVETLKELHDRELSSLRRELAQQRADDRACCDRSDAAAAATLARHEGDLEKRLAAIDQRFGTLQTSWHDRFIAFEKANDARIAAGAKTTDELRRLVYMGVGIAGVVALVAGVLAELLLRH